MSVNLQRRGWHPALAGVLFLVSALVLPLVAADQMVNGDGDPARHLRHGSVILEQGGVIRSDPFSFTRADQPFVGFEYGSQVLLALSDRVGGMAGLVALGTLLISVTLAMLAAWLLRSGLDPLLVLGSVLLTAILSSVHWIARPHLVSWPLIVILLIALERSVAPKAWQVALLFVIWANLHGTFVYGWLLIGLYCVGYLVEAWLDRDQPGRRLEALAAARRVTLLLPIAVGATVLNPYGWRLPWHVLEFFRDPYLRQTTQEFLSPNFHAAEMKPFLLVLLGVMGVLALLPRPRGTHLVVILANIGMALIAQRNVVLFALVGLPLLTLHLGPWWARVSETWPPVHRFGMTARSGRTAPYVAAGLAWLTILVLGRGSLAGRTIVPDTFSRSRFPVDAVASARSARLEGRLFHEFVWGGFLLYAWPETKVFIDGGTDFYGGALVRDYRSIMGLHPGWRDSLDTWRINMVLIRPGSAIAGELNRENGWQRWYCDSTAALFTRRPGSPDPERPSGSGCTLR
jgi:hypothetical protein